MLSVDDAEHPMFISTLPLLKHLSPNFALTHVFCQSILSAHFVQG